MDPGSGSCRCFQTTFLWLAIHRHFGWRCLPFNDLEAMHSEGTPQLRMEINLINLNIPAMRPVAGPQVLNGQADVSLPVKGEATVGESLRWIGCSHGSAMRHDMS